jgi:hypothetical protein
MIARALFIAAILGVVSGWIIFVRRDPEPITSATKALTSAPVPRKMPNAESTLAPPRPKGAVQFEAKLAALLHSLPTVAQLRGSAQKDAHSVNTELLKAGQELGAISEELKHKPEFQPEAEKFYLSCALEENVASSVRALCYHKWSALTAARSSAPPEAQRVPETIRRLSRELGR